tara:strand:- start:8557 stop:9852 length:1296 start_codon:yes stop_codon:yes gene_type:complete
MKSISFLLRRFLFVCSFLFVLTGQNLVDGVAAIVGEHVILKSDVAQLVQMTAMEQRLDPRTNTKELEQLQSRVIESLINQKLILEIAEVESIEVEDREVDQAVEQYIAQSIAQAGSEERLEGMLGKRLSELRREWWPDMREQLIAERYQGQLFGDVVVTRDETVVFYNKFKDSLRTVPTAYNTSHIYLPIEPGEESLGLAFSLADSLRGEIVGGSDFSRLAELYSEDPGSAKQGGVLGFVGRGTLVPAYERIAYSLQPGEISPVVKTEFGYHVIETVELLGDKINTRHILITPKSGPKDEDRTYSKALALKDSIKTIKDFSLFAKKYSGDASTKDSGGRLGWIDSDRFPVEAIRLVLPELDVSVCSTPITAEEGFHLLFVSEVRVGGKPSLETHWAEIEGLAVAEKKNDRFQDWLMNASSAIYVENLLTKD